MLFLRIVNNTLFSIISFIQKILFIKSDFFRNIFISFNNTLVKKSTNGKLESLFLLLPHCLQNSLCNIRLTNSVYNCKLCGKCRLKKILGLTNHYDIPVSIVGGGTQARDQIAQKKSSLIIAVACQRDLAEGIRDIFPHKVFGITNTRPNGPCIDTDVSVKELQNVLQYFLEV